ncbi:MAG: ABC transporter substrate-binding protein, partial [Acidobacteriota bacterium]
EKLEAHTLRFTLKEPYAVGERLFDSIPILPRHRLEPAFREGRLHEAWGLQTPPSEVVGLGPFQVSKYVAGERLELVRNPHYWKVDREGHRLPYLDRLIFLFVAHEDAQALRFKAGEAHLTDRLSARNFALLERYQAKHGYVLRDLGASLNYNFLVFNLNDLEGLEGIDPAIARKQTWFRQVAFRRAVSAAIDRQAIARLVYQGRATPLLTHETPSNPWHNPKLTVPVRSLDSARQLLRSAGFRWRDDGRLLDAEGTPVALSILTSSSNKERSGIATILQADLDELGIAVQIVALEFKALVERVTRSFEYEASLLAFGAGDVDPNSAIGMLTSEGASHLRRLRRRTPPEPWQQEIDRLMEQQLVALDPQRRRRLYDRVQQLVAENQPMIFLVSPNVLTGAASRLGNFKPAILSHFTLWNADELFWRTPAEH